MYYLTIKNSLQNTFKCPYERTTVKKNNYIKMFEICFRLYILFTSYNIGTDEKIFSDIIISNLNAAWEC